MALTDGAGGDAFVVEIERAFAKTRRENLASSIGRESFNIIIMIRLDYDEFHN